MYFIFSMQKNARESTENMNSKILSKGSQIFTFQHFHLREAEFLEYLISTLGRERVKRKTTSFLLVFYYGTATTSLKTSFSENTTSSF